MSLLDTRNGVELTSKGLEVLRNLDSRCFGFLGVQNGQCQQQLAGREGGGAQHPHEPSFISRDFIRVGINKVSQELSQQPHPQAELLCQLGHLYLLLEDYRQAMSTYEQYQSTFPLESSSNVNFLYGVGLIYFHNNAYKWAIEVFQNVLRLSPTFARSSEIHLRLGIMHKKRGEYSRSIDHFRRALSMPGPSSFNKLEIQFHIGHLYYLQENNIAAKEAFETILSSKSVPNPIKGLTLKQLGWLYHTVPELGRLTPDPHAKATELLTLAVGADPTSPQAWYFLGRCHAHQGSIQEAFLAYQYAISKSDESQADTWCSIGLLYHKMLQPKDSLQSYLCAVYLEPHNLASWANMGCLYEAMAQPVDALLSYKNAAAVVRSAKKCPVKCSEHVFSRMTNLEQYLCILGPSVHHQPHALPSLYEAWTTLIPSNIREKRSHSSSPILHLPTPSPSFSPPSHPSNFGPLPPTPNTPHGPPHGPPHLPPHLPIRPLGPPLKRLRSSKCSKDPIIIRNINEGWGSQGVMSPPFTPSVMTPGHGNSTLEPGMRNQIVGMGMFQTGSGMCQDGSSGLQGMDRNGHHSCLPGLADLRTVPSFDSIGRGNALPPHSAIGSFLSEPSSSMTPLNTTAPSHPTSCYPGSSIQTRHVNPSSAQFQLASPIENQALQEAKLDASIGSPDSGTPPIPPQNRSIFPLSRRHLPSRLNTSSDYSADYVSGTSLSSPASSSSSPSLPSLPPTSSVPPSASERPATNLSKPSTSPRSPVTLVATSPMPWEAHFPSGSPVKWVSTVSAASSGPNSASSSKMVSLKPLVSPMPSVLHSESGSFASASPMLSPRSLPLSVPSEAPFSPLIGAGGMNSTFSTSFSPKSLPNLLYGSSIADVPDISYLSSLGVGAEMQQVNDYLDRYLRSHGDVIHSGTAPYDIRAMGKSLFEVVRKESRLPATNFSHSLSSPVDSSAADQASRLGDVSSRFNSSTSNTPSHLQGSQFPPTDSLASLPPGDGPHLISSEDNSASHTPSHLRSTDEDSLADNFLPVSIDLKVAGSFLRRRSQSIAGGDKMTHSLVSDSSSTQGHDRRKSSQSDKSRTGFTIKMKKRSSRSKLRVGKGQLLSCEEPGELMSLLKDHEVSFRKEEISDSGVSSLGNKPFISSSENSSPCETTSPALVSSPTDSRLKNPQRHFSYPEASEGSPRDPKAKVDLIDPIPIPYALYGSEAEYMILNPVIRPPSPPSPKPGMNLNPQIEIYQVKDSVDAFSIDLHGFCTNPDRPICMMRGLCSVLGVDLDAFSSDSLVRTSPNHVIEVRDQIQQAADDNSDPSGRRQVWKCESSRSSTTVHQYAKYQRSIYLEQDELNLSDCYSDSTSSDNATAKARVPVRKRRKMIHFGTNVDLSDAKTWGTQLSEIEKLPKFLRLSCPEADFLQHIGHTILGMNSVQLYMKVPGARTPGHQENNNFCSVNINIGPGDCEWFAVHNQYWGIIHKLCEKNKLCFLTGSWWPILSELEELKVPVYRFTQHLGDVVWLNPGTVHWVQANNVCNNIAWNIGPLTAHQFRMTWERYLWNKHQKVRSIVPLMHMTWNLVQTVKITDAILFEQMRILMEASVLQNKLLLAHLVTSGIEIHWHEQEEGDPTPCCNNCMDEVFNVLFVLNYRREYLVYCHKCASSNLYKGFTVLQQYSMKELDDILDNFKLYPSALSSKTINQLSKHSPASLQ